MSYILTKLRTHQITKLTEKGLSKSEIAERIGIDISSVTYWCRKLCIEPKKIEYGMYRRILSLNRNKKNEIKN